MIKGLDRKKSNNKMTDEQTEISHIENEIISLKNIMKTFLASSAQTSPS